MVKEESFGAIPLKNIEGKWVTFVIKNKSGNHWGFPKGQPDPLEKPMQAAQRELLEETNLKPIKFLKQESLLEEYTFTRNNQTVQKKVYYFLVEVSGEGKITSDEILEGKWVEFNKVKDVLTYESSKKLVNIVEGFLKGL